jgi:hypothetical protein
MIPIRIGIFSLPGRRECGDTRASAAWGGDWREGKGSNQKDQNQQNHHEAKTEPSTSFQPP